MNHQRRNGSTDSAMGKAIDELRMSIDEEFVRVDDATRTRYSRDMGPWKNQCAVVVFPGNTAEVQHAIRVARRHGLDVWPFSKGKNWGYGATVAANSGAMILILERMDRIVEVNEELGYVVVEPGVTQQKLSDYLHKNHPNLWMDCTDSTPEGSVLGNALERGVGYTKYGDHFGNLCGLEVVLPGGETFRTGGGPDGCKTWNTYKYGLGPYVEGLFSQSQHGVVTRGGIWLMPKPADFRAYFLDVEREEDAPGVIDALRRLSMTGAVQSNVHMVNNYLFLTLVEQYPFTLRGDAGCLSKDQIKNICQRNAIPPWSLVGALYGTSQQTAANARLIRKELSRFGALTFIDDPKMDRLSQIVTFCRRWEGTGLVGNAIRKLRELAISHKPLDVLEVVGNVYPILKGIPNDFIVRHCEYFKTRQPIPTGEIDPVRNGTGQGLMWFAPVVPLSGNNVQEVLDLCLPQFQEHDLECALSFIQLNARSVVMLMPLMYERDSEEEARARGLYAALQDSMWRQGYCEYRTSNANKGSQLDYLDLPKLRRRERTKPATASEPMTVQINTEVGSGIPT